MTAEFPREGEIIVERLGGVLRLTMDNLPKKNALSRSMYLELAQALKDVAQDNSIRAVWLRGAGGVFSSGNDVNGFAAPDGELPAPVQFVYALLDFPKPIVAQVEGLAVGIGVTMLLHCDLIYAAEDVKFRMPFVNLGVVPEAGSSYLLPRFMGAAKAADLLLTGRVFSSAEAEAGGIVSRVLPADQLEAAAQEAATALSKQPLNAMRKTRALMRDADRDAMRAHVDNEFRQFFEGTQGPEFAEAVSAFMQKREPDFSNIS